MRHQSPLWRLSFLILFPFFVAALYQDEANHIDYQHALLGTPIEGNTFFHQPSSTSKATLIYTLSEQNVLGALNPRDGSVVWRQQLGNSSAIHQPPGFLRAVNQTNLIYTAVSNKVNSWDAADGRLVAEWTGNGEAKSLELLEGDPLVVFEDNGLSTLVRLNAANAKMMWEVKDKSDEIPVGLTSSSRHLYYVNMVPKLLKGFQIKVTQVEPFSAHPIDKVVLDSQGEVTSRDSIIHLGKQTENPLLAWVDDGLKTLKLNVLGKTAITSVTVEKHGGVAPKRITIHAPTGPKSPPHVLVAYHAKDAHWAEVYHIDKSSGTVNKAYDLPKLGGSGTFAISEASGQVYFVRHSETEISLVLSESHGILVRWPIKPSFHAAPRTTLAAHQSIVEVVPKTAGTYAVRSMLTLESGDVVLVRNGVHDWTRSESLAGIVAAAWADIPKKQSLARTLESEIHANFIAAYIHRLTRHIKDLEKLPAWLQALPQRILSSFGLSAEPIADLSADSFGFRKLAIVATRSGRVAALDSGSNGEVLWNIQAVQLGQGDSWDIKDIIIQEDTAWILANDVEQSVFVTLNGELKTDKLFPDIPKGSRLMPVSTAESTKLVFVSKDGIPGFVSQTEGSEAITLVTQNADSSLVGWTSKGAAVARTWEYVPPEAYRIAAVASRHLHDPVASIGKALGDRSVLYKFLSPNLLLVVSVSDKKHMSIASLIDTVSGQVLHTSEHGAIDTSREVSATFSENWFTYVLQSDPTLGKAEFPGTKGMLLTIVELYESSMPNDRGPLGLTSNFSSFESANYSPHVETATYIIPTTLKHLAITTTKQGITPRSILAYVPSLAALVGMPIAMFAPRRPVGRDPTAGEREEGLFRYLPVIDINPTWTLSHKRELLGINGIISTPSDMESTSLVFAYGDLDIFGTRTAPIGTFDMLGKGFNKMQLILTVVALAFGTGILAPMVKKKQIDTLWRA